MGKGDGVFKKKKIGEILVAQGKVTKEQIDEALAIQKTDARNIGKILVSLGYISEDDLAQALSMRLNVEYVALFEVEVDPEVLGIIEEDVLIQHKAVPLRIEDGRLIVAMSDPNDIYARSDLTISAGFPVTAVVAAEDAVRRLQDQLFGNGAVVDGALAELAGAVQAYRATEEDAEAAQKARRVEPGAQPEADLGEPVREPEGAREQRAVGGREPRGAGSARKTGEILISQGKLTQDQLDQALELQRNDPRDLGKILVSSGYVTSDDLGRALAQRLKLDFVVVADLSDDEVDPAVIDLIREETLRKYTALPLRIEDGRLLIAMADPNDIYALEDLRIIAKRPITPLVATEEDIKGAFAALFETGNPTGSDTADKEDVGRPLEERPLGEGQDAEVFGKQPSVASFRNGEISASGVAGAPPGEAVVPRADGGKPARDGTRGSGRSAVALKVLVADDEPTSSTIVRKTVESYGHTCVVAENGAEAWEIYRRSPDIEVIISDRMMPVMDGLEFCKRVRGLDREKYTFFIFLTALGTEEQLLEGMQAGADEYLTKPLDREQLRVKLEAASRARSLHDHLNEDRSKVRSPNGGALVPTKARNVELRGAKVWDVLVSRGQVSEEQLQQALEAQKTDRRELGKILVSLGHISEKDLAQAQAQRLRLDFVELSERDVDRSAASLVEQKMLRRHAAIPLRIEGGRLVVAMSDPTNIYAL